MWHAHSFSQRKKTSKRVVEMKVGGNREEGWTKFQKDGVGNIGGLHNKGGVRNPLPTISHKELFWKKDVLIVQGEILERPSRGVHYK